MIRCYLALSNPSKKMHPSFWIIENFSPCSLLMYFRKISTLLVNAMVSKTFDQFLITISPEFAQFNFFRDCLQFCF